MSINLKKYGALLLLLTIFLLSAGVTCASQNLSDNVMTIDSDEIHIEDHPDNTNDDIITQSQNNTDGEILSMKSDDMEDNLETSKSGAYSEKQIPNIFPQTLNMNLSHSCTLPLQNIM